MTETLLSTSNILLFGRKVEDLVLKSELVTVSQTVKAATIRKLPNTSGLKTIDGVKLAANEKLLVKDQEDPTQNGIYTVKTGSWGAAVQPNKDNVIEVEEGKRNADTLWLVTQSDASGWIVRRASATGNARFGANRLLEEQLTSASMARIYGFSYEGTYYDLPRPALFLIHGDGDLVTQAGAATPFPSRAPREPSLGGLAAADFQFADDIRVWSYDKADFTVRMDVETGMFEQVLLEMYFDGGGGMGGPVSGSRVAGSRVAGSRVAGSRVAGSRVISPRGRGGSGD